MAHGAADTARMLRSRRVGTIVVGAYIWMSIVAVWKGHGVWVWSLLVPFVGWFGVPYAASRPAKPGSAAFRRFKPGDSRALKSIGAYPIDAARLGIEQDDRSEETIWIEGSPQKLNRETPHQTRSSPIPTKVTQPTPEEQLASFENLHRIGVFSDEQFERLRKRYVDL